MSDILPLSEKCCPRCETVKPASQFQKSHSSGDGLSSYCKSCLWQHKSRDRNPAPEGQKRCSSCQTFKPLEQFFNDSCTKDGKGYECKPCHKERQNRIVSLLEPERERLSTRKGMAHTMRPKEILPEGQKRCLKCDEIKAFEAFGKKRGGQFDLDSYCRECSKKRSRLPVQMPEEKRCPKCETVKPSIEFYVTRSLRSSTGLSAYCRDCSQADARTRVKYSYLQARRKATQSYGITVEDYECMLQEQNGKCASCGYPETTMIRGKVIPLSIDHCHVTDAVRGLLCRRCNQALGILCEDPERIEALLKYTRERVLY